MHWDFKDRRPGRSLRKTVEGGSVREGQLCEQVNNQGNRIAWELSNSAWHTALAKAGITDFRFHDLRHTWASWYRQAGTSCDELKELGGWKSRQIVDRYAKYATEHLTVAAARIVRISSDNKSDEEAVTFLSRQKHERV